VKAPTFEQFVASLSDLRKSGSADSDREFMDGQSGDSLALIEASPDAVTSPIDAVRARMTLASERLSTLEVVDRASLAALIRDDPTLVPVLATFCLLTNEQLKNQLRYGLGSSSWITKARKDRSRVVSLQDPGIYEFKALSQRKSGNCGTV